MVSLAFGFKTPAIVLLCLLINGGVCEDVVEVETKNLYSVMDNDLMNSYGRREKNFKWSTLQQCPHGSVVTGVKFVVSENEVDNPIEGLQGVALQCSKLNYWNRWVEDKIIFHGIVSSKIPWIFGRRREEAVGFTFDEWTEEFGGGGGMDKRRSGNWRLIFGQGGGGPSNFPLNSIERRRGELECPDYYAICGFRVLWDRRFNRILRFRFMCCYHCIPKEMSVVIYDITNNGITDVQRTVNKKVGLTGGERNELSGTQEKKHHFNPGIEGEYGLQNTLSGQGPAANSNSRTLRRRSRSTAKNTKLSHNGGTETTKVMERPHSASAHFLLRMLNLLQTWPSRNDQRTFLNKFHNSRSTLYDILQSSTENWDPPDMHRVSRQGGQPPGGGPSGGSAPGGGPPGGGSSGGGGSPSPPQTSAPSGASAAPASGGGSGSSNFNLKGKFDAKFGTSKTQHFNWQTVSWSIFEFATDETVTMTCKALHRCIVKQLKGICGKYEVNTPTFDYTQSPIRLDYFDYPVEAGGGGGGGGEARDDAMISDMAKVDRPSGENWIVLKKLTFAKRSRIWGKPKLCPPGSVVTAQQIRNKRGISFSGLSLQCSKLNSSSQFEPMTIMSVGTGDGMSWYNSSTEGIGASQIQFQMNNGSTAMFKQNFEIRFNGEENYMRIPSGAQNVVRTEAMCPTNHAICGMRGMFDVDQRGEMTDIAFRCCYHCDPQEKTVVLESFTNLGYTDTLQTVTRIVGNSINSSRSHSGNNLTENANVLDGVNPAGLQVGFATKFDQKVDSGFNWANTSTSFWTQREEKTMTVSCRARTLCVMKQLVGICNGIEIPTPKIIKESFPLGSSPAADETLNKNGQLRIKRSGEMWMVAENLTFSQRSDNWGQPMMCPPGMFVTGQQFKRSARSYLSGLNLQCSFLNDRDEFVPATKLTSGFGNDTKWYDAKAPAIGFTFVQYELNGTRWKAKWEMRFENEMTFLPIPSGVKNMTRSFVQCPPGQAVSGIMTMFDATNIGQLTNLGFKCSLFCRPRQKFIILATLTNSGYMNMTQSIQYSLGIRNNSAPAVNFTRFSNVEEQNPTEGALPMTPTPSPENAADLLSMFTHKFPQQENYEGFSWADSPSSVFTTMEEKNMELFCKARHACSFKQLVSSCGDFEIFSPYTIQRMTSLEGKEKKPVGVEQSKKKMYKKNRVP